MYHSYVIHLLAVAAGSRQPAAGSWQARGQFSRGLFVGEQKARGQTASDLRWLPNEWDVAI